MHKWNWTGLRFYLSEVDFDSEKELLGLASRANRFSEKFKMYSGGKETGWTRDIQRERNYEVEDLNNMSWFDTWHQDMRNNVRVKNTNIQVEQQQQQQQRQLQQVNWSSFNNFKPR